MSHRYWANQYPYSGTWTRAWEPGPVLGNLDLHRSLVRDLYSGTWTRTREPVSYTNSRDSFIKADRLGCGTQLEQSSAQRKQF